METPNNSALLFSPGYIFSYDMFLKHLLFAYYVCFQIS